MFSVDQSRAQPLVFTGLLRWDTAVNPWNAEDTDSDLQCDDLG